MTPITRKILTRYNAASPAEFAYYAQGLPMPYLRRALNRSERTINDWLHGNRIIPPWAIAVLRLQRLEHELRMDEMGYRRRPEAQHGSAHPRQKRVGTIYDRRIQRVRAHDAGRKHQHDAEVQRNDPQSLRLTFRIFHLSSTRLFPKPANPCVPGFAAPSCLSIR